jgi:hypothetical protein
VFWLIALAVSLPFASKLSSILTGSEPFEVYASRMRLSHFASAAAKMSTKPLPDSQTVVLRKWQEWSKLGGILRTERNRFHGLWWLLGTSVRKSDGCAPDCFVFLGAVACTDESILEHFSCLPVSGRADAVHLLMRRKLTGRCFQTLCWLLGTSVRKKDDFALAFFIFLAALVIN